VRFGLVLGGGGLQGAAWLAPALVVLRDDCSSRCPPTSSRWASP